MGDRQTASGASNFARRTWDKAEYAERAAERAAKEEAGDESLDLLPDGRRAPAPYRDAPEGFARPEGSARGYVQARTYELHLDAKLNKKKVRSEAGQVPSQPTGCIAGLGIGRRSTRPSHVMFVATFLAVPHF